MKTILIRLAGAGLLILAIGCYTPEGQPNRAGSGALLGGALGAVTGAIIGGATGDAGAGAVIGGALGAVTGGVIGGALDQQERSILARQSPATLQRLDEGQPLLPADIKALSQAGVSDEVIISQIRNTRTRYRLSTAEIIDLKNAGVSDRVIDYMINTASQNFTSTSATVVAPEPPPPPRVETVVVAPGPGYVWVSGEWVWQGRWVWSPGYWTVPPWPGCVWIHGSWYRGPRGWHYHRGHWRR